MLNFFRRLRGPRLTCGWGLCEERATNSVSIIRDCGHGQREVPTCFDHLKFIEETGWRSLVPVVCGECGVVNQSTATLELESKMFNA